MATVDFVAALDMSLDDVISAEQKPGRWSAKNSKGAGKAAEKKSAEAPTKIASPSKGKDALTADVTKSLSMSLDEVIAQDRPHGKGGKAAGKTEQKDAASRTKVAISAGKNSTASKTWDNSKDAGYSKKHTATEGDSWKADNTWSDKSQSTKAWNSAKKDGWKESKGAWKGGDNSGKEHWERPKAWSKPADQGQYGAAAGGSWNSWSHEKSSQQSYGASWNAAESSSNYGWREPQADHDGRRDPRDYQRRTEQRIGGYPAHEHVDHRFHAEPHSAAHHRGNEWMDSRGPVDRAPAGGYRGVNDGTARNTWRADPEASGYEWGHAPNRGASDRQRPNEGAHWPTGQKRRYEDPSESRPCKTVKVTNIPFELDENDITKAFEKEAGKIVNCWSEGRGSIVMVFARADDALTAVETFHKGELNKRVIDVVLEH